MKQIFPAALATAMLAIATPAAAAAPIEGRWVTEEKDSIVEIKPCGNSICGRIVKFLKAPPKPNPKDTENPNPKLRSRPIMGMAVLSGFKLHDADDGEYKGTIYDPRNGKSYKSFLSVNDNGTLKVQGCVGPFCQSQTWRKAG